MRGLSITGLVLGVLAPIVVLLPLLLAPFGSNEYWQVGWAFFFFTVPVGALLGVAGTVLCIIAASLAMARSRARAVPIVGICLIGAGLLGAGLGSWAVVSDGSTWSVGSLFIAFAMFLAGVILAAIAGLRASRVPRRAASR